MELASAVWVALRLREEGLGVLGKLRELADFLVGMLLT
jgi:hypothetical protein